MDIEKATAWCTKMEELLGGKNVEVKSLALQISKVESLLDGERPEDVDSEKWEELESTLRELKAGTKPKTKKQTQLQFTDKQIEDWREFIAEVKVTAGVVKVDDVQEVLNQYYDIRSASKAEDAPEWGELEEHLLFDGKDEDYEFTAPEIVLASELLERARAIANGLRYVQSITVSKKELMYGQALSELGASSKGGETLEYYVDEDEFAADKVLNAIERAYSILIKANGTDDYKPCELEIEVTVKKAASKVYWPRPMPLLKNSSLTASTLNAKVQNASGDILDSQPSISYAPTINTKATKTIELKGDFKGSGNYLPSSTTVELQVVDTLAELGKQAMMDGRARKKSDIEEHEALLKTWNTDDSTTGLKAQSKLVMSKIKDMTGDELVDYMDNYLSSEGGAGSGSISQGHGATLNLIWYFPNGMQVRYKPNNPAKPPLSGIEPMFCVEGKTSVGPSGSKADVAFKVTMIGEPGAYGPAETQIPEGVPTDKNDIKNQEYMDAACGTTHLCCIPMVEQTILWTPPPSIIVGQPLGADSLKPTADDLTALRFTDVNNTPISESTLLAAGEHTLRVRAVKTLRFLASTAPVEVKIVVHKKDQTLEWKPKTVVLEVGTPLGEAVLNATANSKLQPVYRYESTVVTKDTKLAANRYRLRAIAEATPEYNSSEPIEIEISVNKKVQTLQWEPKQTVLEVGTALGDLVLNATTSSGIAPIYTSGEQVVNKSTKLPANTYELKAVAPENAEYLESNSKTIQISVKESVKENDKL